MGKRTKRLLAVSAEGALTNDDGELAGALGSHADIDGVDITRHRGIKVEVLGVAGGHREGEFYVRLCLRWSGDGDRQSREICHIRVHRHVGCWDKWKREQKCRKNEHRTHGCT